MDLVTYSKVQLQKLKTRLILTIFSCLQVFFFFFLESKTSCRKHIFLHNCIRKKKYINYDVPSFHYYYFYLNIFEIKKNEIGKFIIFWEEEKEKKVKEVWNKWVLNYVSSRKQKEQDSRLPELWIQLPGFLWLILKENTIESIRGVLWHSIRWELLLKKAKRLRKRLGKKALLPTQIRSHLHIIFT